MEKLVNEKNMVILYPDLATKIGLNEAIMLQHIHFWLQDSKHHKDGRVWVYNTYQSWQKQLPFWSTETIKRIIRRLEKNGYLLSANYNQLKIDKTKWYSIDYEKVAEIEEKETGSTGKDALSENTTCSAEEVTCTQALPKSTTNNTSKKEIDSDPSNEEHAETTASHKPNICQMESIIREVFPHGLKKDWIDHIYQIYDSFSEEISLPAYKRVLKEVSKNVARVTRFDRYLEKAVKNELYPKQTALSETPIHRKPIREEFVPKWLKENKLKPQKEPEPPVINKDLEARRLALLVNIKKLKMGGSLCY